MVRAIEPGVGPLAQQRLDEGLGLAVGLGSVGPGAQVPGAELVEDRGVGPALGVGPRVVGHDPLDAHAVLSEEDGRLGEGPGGAGARLVGDDRHVGDPGRVVDEHLEVVVAAARRWR